jgi:hypothetical protein
MKLISAVATLALASATAPPRIELDLSGGSSTQVASGGTTGGSMSTGGAGIFKLASAVIRTHDLGYKQPDLATNVISKQEITMVCEAGPTAATTCKIPTAKAWDWQDQTVPITTRIFLIDEDGTTRYISKSEVDYTKRKTYMFRYDARDSSGNYAQQVVFVLDLNDITPPVITWCGTAASNAGSETIEAGGGYRPGESKCPAKWYLCAGTEATDNQDGDVSATLKYTVEKLGGIGDTADFRVQLGSYTAAKDAITSEELGQFKVTATANDYANIYGLNYVNNVNTADKLITVQDTFAPWIEIVGSTPQIQECGKVYEDHHAVAVDCMDTLSAPHTAIQVTSTSQVNIHLAGSYSVFYDAQDAGTLDALQVTRTVTVEDHIRPEHALNGAAVVTHYANTAFVELGTTCTDLCDRFNYAWTGTDPAETSHGRIALSWDRAFVDTTPGHYIRTYKCTDVAGNYREIFRTFVVVDQNIPVIDVQGTEDLTLEASEDLEYTDAGATCQDRENGVLDHAVMVSGDIVNRRIPGVYTVKYNCMDLAKNAAIQQTRKVTVHDTTCPVITLLGSPINFIEAGFTYTDAHATATDNIDGTITSRIWTTGDTVDVADHFNTKRSCGAIKSDMLARENLIANSGDYWISTGSGVRQQVVCDFHTAGGPYTLKACGAIGTPCSTSTDACAAMGMTKVDASFATAVAANYGADYVYSGTSTLYVCTTSAAELHPYTPGFDAKHPSHTSAARAEVGKYAIQFHVNDKSGNTDESCGAAGTWRTVIVKDTLPPVISLVFNSKLVHVSDETAQGIGQGDNSATADTIKSTTGLPAVANSFPISDDTWNTNHGPNTPEATDTWEDDYTSASQTHDAATTGTLLMAEESQASASAWIAGAVASGVTGLALLAYGSK